MEITLRFIVLLIHYAILIFAFELLMHDLLMAKCPTLKANLCDVKIHIHLQERKRTKN